MITVVFPLTEVLLLAEHALAATSHAASMHEVLHNTAPRPALWLVGDQGLFLMSNGLVTPPDVDDGGGLPVVYAEGYQTHTAWLAIANRLGHGKQIRAVLALLDPAGDQRILHHDLTAGAAAGAAAFVIELDTRHLRWHVPTTGTTEATR